VRSPSESRHPSTPSSRPPWRRVSWRTWYGRSLQGAGGREAFRHPACR